MSESTLMLRCTSCDIDKPTGEFHKNRARSRGYSYQCRTCKGALDKQSYSEENNKRSKLLERYGIDLDAYNAMFTEQQGCCAICNAHQSSLKRSLAVDHCHETGKVRGLLCTNCNVGLGNFKDSLTNLNTAIAYLSKGE